MFRSDGMRGVMAGLFLAFPGHPRLGSRPKDVDARDRRQVYAVCASLTAFQRMTGIETSGISASNA